MSEETSAKPAPVRMTAAQKSEATALYRAGTHTAEEIALKLGVNVATLRTFFTRKGIKKGDLAKQVEAQKEAAIQAAIAIDPALHARRVFDTKNETYRYIEIIRKLAVKTLVECQQQGRPLGTIQNDMKALREAAATVKTCREEAFAVLGIKPEDAGDEQLPSLEITGLSEEQITQLQNAQVEDDGIGEVPDLDDE